MCFKYEMLHLIKKLKNMNVFLNFGLINKGTPNTEKSDPFEKLVNVVIDEDNSPLLI